MDRKVITIDGLAGSGKSVLAKMLAEKLGYAHLNSGAIYRCVGYLALKSGVSLADERGLRQLIEQHTIELRSIDHQPVVCLDQKICGEELFTSEISSATSQVAAHPLVREALIAIQRTAFLGSGLVAEGRDMGTVIFPEAELKIFVGADVGIRARRRAAQLYPEITDWGSSRGIELLQDLSAQIEERDARDSQRSTAPTKPAADAVFIENSEQTLTDVVSNMYNLVAQRGLVENTSDYR